MILAMRHLLPPLCLALAATSSSAQELPALPPIEWSGGASQVGGGRWAVLVVADTYPRNPTWRLEKADAVVKRLTEAFDRGLGIRGERLRMIRGSDVTNAAIQEVLREVGERLRGPDNLVVFYYYGHGWTKNEQVELFTKDTVHRHGSFQNTLGWSELGLHFGGLVQAADEQKAATRIVSVIDACRVKEQQAPPGPAKYVPLEKIVASIYATEVGQFATEGVFCDGFAASLEEFAGRDETRLGDLVEGAAKRMKGQTPVRMQGEPELVLRQRNDLAVEIVVRDAIGAGKALDGAHAATVTFGKHSGRSPLPLTGLPPGVYDLRVEHPDYLPREHRVELGPANAGEKVVVTLLPRLVVVTGQVEARGRVRILVTGARPRGTIDGYHVLRAERDGSGPFQLLLPRLPEDGALLVQAEGVEKIVPIPASPTGRLAERFDRHDVGLVTLAPKGPADASPPRITVAAPTRDLVTRDAAVTIRATVTDEGPAEATVDGRSVPLRDGTLQHEWALREGRNAVVLGAKDAAGNVAAPVTLEVTRDSTPPTLTVEEPLDGLVTREGAVRLRAHASDQLRLAAVLVDGKPVAVRDGVVDLPLELREGTTSLVVGALDAAGNAAPQVTLRVTRDSTPPAVTIVGPAEGAEAKGDRVRVVLRIEDVTWTTVRWGQGGARVERGQAFDQEVPLAGAGLELEVQDQAGNVTSVRRALTRPGDGPAWYSRWSREQRPPWPLPAGLRPGPVEKTFVNAADGSVLVWVPPGSFTIGGEDEDSSPSKTITFARGYFLGRCEVSWAQYARFARAKDVAMPSGEAGPADHPVYRVSWESARAYCRWAGLDLPTEAEWEYGALGDQDRSFPWGGGSGSCNARGSSDGHPRTAPVDSMPDGASPWGALHMAGNVAEWCLDAYRKGYEGLPGDGSVRPGDSATRVTRGGSWNNSEQACSSTVRTPRAPGDATPYLGFRVVRRIGP